MLVKLELLKLLVLKKPIYFLEVETNRIKNTNRPIQGIKKMVYIYMQTTLFILLSYVLIASINIKNINLNLKSSLFEIKPRIFCIIFTIPENYISKATVIHQTWGHKCDNHKFISVIPNKHLNQSRIKNNSTEIKFNNFTILQPAGFIKDAYRNLTEKLYLAIRHVYSNYNDYDWYIKADDDTFIHMNNLRLFLATKNPYKPVTYGYDFKLYVKNGYHSGGGYVLSKNALNRIGAKLTENEKFCPNSGTEDVDIARCLRLLDVYPNKSLDSLGRERFHMFSIDEYFKSQLPSWIYKWASNVPQLVTFSYHLPIS